MMHIALWVLTVLSAAVLPPLLAQSAEAVEPQGTAALEGEADFASEMIDGIDRFLLRKIDQAAAVREAAWRELDTSSPEALQQGLEPHRRKLAEILGVTEERLPFDGPEFVAAAGESAAVASSDRFDAFEVRWPVLGDPSTQLAGLPSTVGEGIMLVPRSDILANVIVLGDASQTPEQLCGLAEGLPQNSQVARRLAEQGCRVVIPHVISRTREKYGQASLTHREYLHRSAFVLGRTLAGHEVQSVLSLVDWLERESSGEVGVFGYGEGGMLAIMAAGVDPRIDAACVSGFFGPRSGSWQEPLDRNFFGMQEHFDSPELAMLLAGRRLIVETSRGPELELAGEGGAPAVLRSPDPAAAAEMLEAAKRRLGGDGEGGKGAAEGLMLVNPPDGRWGSDAALSRLLAGLGHSRGIDAAEGLSELKVLRPTQGADARERRLVQQIDRHNQALLDESPYVRDAFMAKLDTTSLDAFKRSQEPYRKTFRDEIIGRFEEPLLPPAARSRRAWETEKWVGYEVQLDVFPDVFTYGALLLPRDLKPGERRPVVVCQHGLEGRPVDTFQGDHRAYRDFAGKLCERGFVVFAPQNPYIFKDRFRTLQRKAQPLGKTLFSVIVPQHQQVVDWLKGQPFVDGDRIAFYGLSYGGKTAMRVPALVNDYCLSICSADFNEWVVKNASTRHPFSYVGTGEYEIFEWNLGGTFNYAEMAALICPRPFMVERGHFDNVGRDEWVAYEYAKVRNLYAAKLGIGERTEIEWFVGPHTINGQATFDFLHRHLDWPRPAE